MDVSFGLPFTHDKLDNKAIVASYKHGAKRPVTAPYFSRNPDKQKFNQKPDEVDSVHN